MPERKYELSFNTAVTAIIDENGVVDGEAHCLKVAPLRAKIMQIDGIDDCIIERYGINLWYQSIVITPEALLAAISEIIETTVEREDLFPLRGDKIPRVIHTSSGAKVRPRPPVYRPPARRKKREPSMFDLFDPRGSAFDPRGWF